MMSLLSYNELIELMEKRIINCPLENINGTSIDITLDYDIMYENIIPTKDIVDLQHKQSPMMIRNSMRKTGGFYLSPGQFVLASSAEVFNLPNNISAEYKLKSSLARSGLQHLLAGWCDPGWSDSKLTLELKNVTQFHTLVLRPGMKIGQMVFWKSEPVPDIANYSATGQYNKQTSVTGNKGVR